MKCAEKTKLDFNKIDACTHSKLANQLQHMYGVQTNSLQPSLTYVPWITINGEHNEELENEAEKNLIQLLCKFYRVNKRSLNNSLSE